MTPFALHRELTRLGVTLKIEAGDRIRYRAQGDCLTAGIREEIQRNRAALISMACDRCHTVADRLVHAYWGDRLCPTCCRSVAAEFDRTETWPVDERIASGQTEAQALVLVASAFGLGCLS